MYWNYTEGSYTVQEEEEMLVLGYNPKNFLQDQIMFRTYEFYSILDDHDEQDLDSIFGLGI